MKLIRTKAVPAMFLAAMLAAAAFLPSGYGAAKADAWADAAKSVDADGNQVRQVRNGGATETWVLVGVFGADDGKLQELGFRPEEIKDGEPGEEWKDSEAAEKGKRKLKRRKRKKRRNASDYLVDVPYRWTFIQDNRGSGR